MAGLKLANNCKSLLSLNNPCSGLWSNGKLSHFGPPTAPKRTASDFLAFSIVSSLIGNLKASIHAPPTSSSSISISSIFFLLKKTICLKNL